MKFTLLKKLIPDFWPYLFQFYEMYASKYKLTVFLLFLGAVVSGVIEILGLILLYLMIKMLINIESLSDDHFLISFMNSLGVESIDGVIKWTGFTIALIFILKNVYIVAYYQFQHNTLRVWKNQLSLDLMRKYLQAPYLFLLGYNSSTLVRNISGIVSSALNGFVLSGLNFLANIISGVLILSLLYLRYTGITVVVAGILLVSTVIQNLFLNSRSRKIGEERNELMLAQSKNVYQGFHAIKETKVIGKEEHFLGAFKNIVYSVMDNDSKNLFYSRLPSHITELVIIVSIVLICVVILTEPGVRTETSVASLGVLAAIAFRIAPIMNRTLSAMQSMNKNISSIKTLFNEIRKMDALSVSDPESDVNGTPMKFESNIVLERIGFRYKKEDAAAIAAISCEVKKGEFIGIVGTSGAGKTTLIDVLLGLLHPSAGKILVDGVQLTKANIRDWQKNLSYVPQSIYLNDDSIKRNIAFGVNDEDINEESVWDLLRAVGLDSLVEDLDGKLEYSVGENGKHLSGGQRQRIGIARALYLKRPVLIMDEATSALDAPSEQSISKAILKYKGERTIFAIAHRLSTVYDADRIMFMKNGRLDQFDSFKKLYEENLDFRSIADAAKIKI